jgi:dTDP-4-amino-4,6-dideoxygalactose transaminase
MDPGKAAALTGRHTKALLPVHLYGQMAPMDELGVLARAAGADLLEDAAQAHGALQHGKPPGAMGLAAAFSFYPSKNLGAYGDAGGVVTGSDALAARLRRLRNYGSDAKYVHPELGFNSRLDTLHAVVLSAKLKRLALWNAARRAAAARYDEMLSSIPDVVRPSVRDGNVHVWHLYVVRVPNRDRVAERLRADGIGAGIHYPIPVHLQGAFGYLGHAEGDFPQAERAAREVLSLPMYPSLTAPEQERVAASLAKALAS